MCCTGGRLDTELQCLVNNWCLPLVVAVTPTLLEGAAVRTSVEVVEMSSVLWTCTTSA